MFHTEGSINEIAFCLMFVLQKGILIKFCKFISCIYSTMWSKFKNFIQIIRTSVIHKFTCNSVYMWDVSVELVWFPLAGSVVISSPINIWSIHREKWLYFSALESCPLFIVELISRDLFKSCVQASYFSFLKAVIYKRYILKCDKVFSS